MTPDLLAPEALGDAFAPFGLPAPVRAERVSPPGPVVEYRVRFAAELQIPEHALCAFADPRRRPPVAVSFAAMELAREVVEVAPAFAVAGLPWPALLRERRGGRPDAQDVPRHLVDLLFALDERRFDGWGDAPVPGGFAPSARDWRSAWEQRIDEAWAAARGVGPLADALRTGARAGLPALADAPFRLVHGALAPHQIEAGRASGGVSVVGWDQALIGDPLLDWATAFEAPQNALVGGLAGRAAPRLFEPGAVARLETYLRTLALERLAEATRPWAERLPWVRVGWIEAGRAAAHAVLEPGFVSRRLDAVKGIRPDARPPERPGECSLVRRGAFEVLRHPQGAYPLGLASALASSESGADRFAEQASRFLPLAGAHGAWPPAPIPDRAAWRADQIELALRAPSVSSGVGLALLAIGLRAIDAAAGEVCDGALRGLARMAHATRAERTTWRDAVAAYAAVRALGGDPGPLESALAAVPEETVSDPDDALDGLAFTEWVDSAEAPWIPLLIWSLPHLPETIRGRVAGQIAS